MERMNGKVLLSTECMTKGRRSSTRNIRSVRVQAKMTRNAIVVGKRDTLVIIPSDQQMERLAANVESQIILLKNARPNNPAEQVETGGKWTTWTLESDDECAFSVNSSHAQTVDVTVGGQQIRMIIDSGASMNAIDENVWVKLKGNKVKCTSKKCNKSLYTYGSQKPLEVLGSFTATAAVGDKETEGKFIVIKGKGEPLLGRHTAVQLGVLKVGLNINSVTSKETILEKHKEVLENSPITKSHYMWIQVLAQSPNQLGAYPWFSETKCSPKSRNW